MIEKCTSKVTSTEQILRWLRLHTCKPEKKVPTLRTMVVDLHVLQFSSVFFSFLQLAVGSRDLSQAEKEITLCKAEQIHKMTTIFTQNGPRLSF